MTKKRTPLPFLLEKTRKESKDEGSVFYTRFIDLDDESGKLVEDKKLIAITVVMISHDTKVQQLDC